MRVYCSECRDVHVFPCNGTVAGYEIPIEAPPWLAVTESLGRRLDALEKAGTTSFGTEDPKDALIRDLMTWVSNYKSRGPDVFWSQAELSLRARAEKFVGKL